MLGCIPVCEIINGFNIFHAFLLKRTRYLWESYNIISQKVANAYLQENPRKSKKIKKNPRKSKKNP